jgi:hypothetical protein
MPKYHGRIGFIETEEIAQDIFDEVVTERVYSGDILRMSKSWQNGEHLNDNLQVNVQISFLADPYAYQHFHALRYVEWMGALWKITNAEPQYPRIILTIGGVYNGPQDRTE